MTIILAKKKFIKTIRKNNKKKIYLNLKANQKIENKPKKIKKKINKFNKILIKVIIKKKLINNKHIKRILKFMTKIIIMIMQFKIYHL